MAAGAGFLRRPQHALPVPVARPGVRGELRQTSGAISDPVPAARRRGRCAGGTSASLGSSAYNKVTPSRARPRSTAGRTTSRSIHPESTISIEAPGDRCSTTSSRKRTWMPVPARRPATADTARPCRRWPGRRRAPARVRPARSNQASGASRRRAWESRGWWAPGMPVTVTASRTSSASRPWSARTRTAPALAPSGGVMPYRQGGHGSLRVSESRPRTGDCLARIE